MKVSYPTSAEEATKTVMSALVGAPAVLDFDDMQLDRKPFGALNRALTSPTITDRLLMTNRMVTVGTRCLVLGTGNNVVPVRDMARRVVTIRLHHGAETPALQRYSGDSVAAITKGRARYVAAALTIIRAYRQAGAPKQDLPSIASFGV